MINKLEITGSVKQWLQWKAVFFLWDEAEKYYENCQYLVLTVFVAEVTVFRVGRWSVIRRLATFHVHA
jgi:hypothetical protein